MCQIGRVEVLRVFKEGACDLQEKSGCCDFCIMVRDFPNSTDQLDEIALTIYLSGVPSRSSAEKAWKQRIHSNGKEFSAVPFRMEKEEYL